MKKVFVFLSVFALTIALIGFSAKNSTKSYAAGELFTEDPTLSKNEIPMYIMNSIYTTFPNHYDYVNGGDDQWGGSSRMYTWNETRLQVKLIDDAGEFTGKEYAIFFSGSTNGSVGTGNNLLFYAYNEATGKVELARKDASNGNTIKFSGGLAMDPSLSHMRTNISGQDITFEASEMYNGDDQGNNLLMRSFVFDADGRMIRGIAMSGGHARPTEEEPGLANRMTPEYCFVNGVVAKVEEGVVCDNYVEKKVDEKTGEITETVTDEPDYVYDRFLWQWVSAEEYASEDFVGVNEVPYLAEGWDAQKWDYANYEEESDGYICIAFVRGEQSAFANSITLTEAQLAVYTETCAANGLPAPDANTKRNFARQITVPAGGIVYDFGYLDNGIPALQEKFFDMFLDGYKYGRKVQEVGTNEAGEPVYKGMGYGKTCDFSVSPLYFKDYASNGYSYQLMDGQNTIEVMAGEKFTPSNGVVYTGMSKYWAVPNDFTSFQSDDTALDLYITVDGVTVVQPNTGYNSFEEMKEDFVNDLSTFLVNEHGKQPLEVPAKVAADASQDDLKAAIGGTNGAWYSAVNNNIAYTNDTHNSFIKNDEMWAKWSWLFEYMNVYLAADKSGLAINTAKRQLEGSVGNFSYAMWGFLTEAPVISGWPSSKVDWSNGKATGWLDTRTNLEKWEQYQIDTLLDNVDKNYIVEYKAVNRITGLESSLNIKYVVVDEYTPILEVNKAALICPPTVVDGKVNMPVIDEYTFATAYNARYNGKSLLGDDISYKIHYSSETLDFDAPTSGEHVVTAKVYNNVKYAEKSFTVVIEDMEAPLVKVYSDMVIGVGEVFVPATAVYYAYDNVDGNLLAGHVKDWVDYSGKAPDTSKPGKYNVGIVVYDKVGNSYETSVSLTVVGASDTDAKFEELAGAIDNLEVVLSAKIDEANSSTQSSGCAMPAAALVQVLAASSLLVVFLRKRH